MASDLKYRLLFIALLTLVSVYFAVPTADKPGFREGQWLAGKTYKLGLDLQGGVEMTLVVDPTGEDRKEQRDAAGNVSRAARSIRELSESVRAVIDRRINIRGLKEPVIRTQGDDKIQIQLPGIDESEVARVKSLLQRSGRLEFRLVATESEMDTWKAPPSAPAGYEWLKNSSGSRDETSRPFLLCETQAKVTGQDVISALPEVDTSRFDQPEQHVGPAWRISFHLSPMGGKHFGELTGPNVNRRLAIVLDNDVRSAPVIRAQISSEGVIEGRFSEAEARDLATTLRSGSLPCRVAIEGHGSVSYIGATLGEESIRNGTLACILACIIVSLFMAVYYRGLGVISVVSLLLNLVFLLATMAFFGATLTLPGIAGLILTIGMAVDGNILVYERIREERDRGKTPAQAFEAGHERAFVTIVDSNLTTLAAGIILYFFGSGPIQGFAVTTSVGILTTLFTVLFCSKAFIRLCMGLGLLGEFKMMRIFSKPSLPFTSLFRLCAIGSVTAIVIGIVAMAFRGAENFGPDFRGGSVIQPRFTEEIGTTALLKEFEGITIADAKGASLKKYADLDILSVVPPEEGRDLGQGLRNIFKGFVSSGSREHQIRTSALYPGLSEGAIDTVAPEAGQIESPFTKGLRLTFIPMRVVASPAEVQAVVEKALPAAETAVKPKVELVAGDRRFPPTVVVSLTRSQAEQKDAVTAALRKEIGVVNSLRDDILEKFGPRLAPQPFVNERPATDNARDAFFGGKTVTVNLAAPATSAAVASVLKEVFSGVTDTKEIYKVESAGAAPDAPATAHHLSLAASAWGRYDEIKTALREAGLKSPAPLVLAKGPFQKEDVIGSAVARDLKENAIIACILSWVVMILYLAVRFRSWIYGVAAVVALVHDVLFSLGAVALCGLLVPKSWGLNFEFSLQTVAAALTIIGYSVNDTIVIYDRIRENIQIMRREPLRKIIDLSCNQTLSRTILTSLTVFLVVVLLYAVTMRSAGGIAEFAFPMIVGVVVGTYSSIYIASPFLLLGKRTEATARPPVPASAP